MRLSPCQGESLGEALPPGKGGGEQVVSPLTGGRSCRYSFILLNVRSGMARMSAMIGRQMLRT